MKNLSQPDSSVPQEPASGKECRQSLLWFERITAVSGLALLLAFAGLHFDQDQSSKAGLAAFYQQAHAAGLEQAGAPDDSNSRVGASHALVAQPAASSLVTRPPDFELWSEKRIREYQASLQQEADTPLGVLRIERLDIEVPVYNGTDEFVLNRGVGRIIGTARVDSPGNLGIAGHRDGFFRGLKDIRQGDVLELQTTRGAIKYRVGSTVIVDPDDVSVLAPTAEHTITLVTCYPFYFVGHAPKRFIVQAKAEPQIAMN